MKTNAARILDQMRVVYSLRTYDLGDVPFSAEAVAEALGMPPTRVFKTLVVRGDRSGVCFAVIAAHSRLDQKALARLTGDRKIEPVPLRDVETLTGYVRGGVTAIGAKKAYPVYVDEAMVLEEQVAVSAGHPGVQLLMSPADYVGVVRAPGGRYRSGGLAAGVGAGRDRTRHASATITARPQTFRTCGTPGATTRLRAPPSPQR